MQRSRYLKKCRLCQNKNLSSYFDFGNIPLGNNLQTSMKESISVKTYPLNVVRCNTCNHFQLNYSVSPNLLYATNYTYLSGVGGSFVKHIEDYVLWINTKCKLNSKKFIFEIGSNDGTCLEKFKNLGHMVCGIDPAELPAKIANQKGIYTINNFFDDSSVNYVLKKFGNPDVITSQNALAHIDDLVNTFKRIYFLLKKNGYFVFEVGYFGKVLQRNLFDTIYHEHLDYHHANPLVSHLVHQGFEILNISVNESQGGSIRLLLKKTGKKKVSKQAEKFLEKERLSLLYNTTYLENWLLKIKTNMKKVKNYVKKLKDLNFTILGYGAPTKSVLMMNVAKLNQDDIDFIVEDNTLKINKYIPKHGILIKSVKELSKYKNFSIIILAWNFRKDIVKKLKKQKLKPIIVVPLPKFEVKKL